MTLKLIYYYQLWKEKFREMAPRLLIKYFTFFLPPHTYIAPFMKQEQQQQP